MKVLAIDSSGLTASVALVDESVRIAEYTINYKKTHSQTLLPMIDEIVKMTEQDLHAIDAIVVSGGPGSFTGLRIGSATAKGLGLALKKPLIHVPTVDGLAYQLYGCADIICPIMDARRNQVYTGMYTFTKKEGTPQFQVLEQQMAIPLEDLIQMLNKNGKPVMFLGDAVPVYQSQLEKGLNIPYSFAPAFLNRQNAAAIGVLGIQYFKAGKFSAARDHQPDYLRVSQAERERAERELAEQKQAAGLIVRQTIPADVNALAELEQQIFSDPWSVTSISETVRQPHAICVTAEKSGRVAGYLFLYAVAGEGEIVRIAVANDLRRQGVGTDLMRELETICQNEKIAKLNLEVRESNVEARAFYAAHCFEENGLRRSFYDNPCEDAILMSRVIERSEQSPASGT